MRKLVNFHASSRISENLHFDIFRWKNTEELCLMTLKSDTKFDEKLTLGSKNDTRNLVNFNTSSGISENLLFDLLLLLIVYYVWANKSTEELCVITLKKGAKFEEELTCAQHSKVSKFALQWKSFWLKYIMFELQNYRGIIRNYTEDRCKLWKKNDMWFRKWHEKFVNFTAVLKNLKIYIFREKLQSCSVSWHWKVMQYLEKDWLVVRKMTLVLG